MLARFRKLGKLTLYKAPPPHARAGRAAT